MARHSERRSEQTQPPSAPTGPRWQEVTRFPSVKLREINNSAIAFVDAHPGCSKEDLVAHISTSINEKPSRVDMALVVINQLGSLSQRPVADGLPEYPKHIVGPDDLTGEVVIRVDLNKPGKKLIYEVKWAEEEPESLKEPKTQAISEPRKRRSAFQFETVEYRAMERSGRILQDQREARERLEKFRQEKAQRAELEKIVAEKNELREVIIDRGKDIAETNLANKRLKIELDEDGRAVVLFNEGVIDPQYVVVDRATGEYDAGMYIKYKVSVRADVMRYVEIKAQEMERAANPEAPDPAQYRPADMSQTPEQVYNRAIELGLLKVDTSQEEVRFSLTQFPFGGYDTVEIETPIDLERGVSLKARLIDEEHSIHPQFVEFLKGKKTELERAKPASENQDDSTRRLYERALEDGSLVVRIEEDGKVIFSWRYGRQDGVGFYADIDVAKGRTKPHEFNFQGDPLTSQFTALLKKEEARLNVDKKSAQALAEKTNIPGREVVNINVSLLDQ